MILDLKKGDTVSVSQIDQLIFGKKHLAFYLSESIVIAEIGEHVFKRPVRPNTEYTYVGKRNGGL